MMRNGFDPHIFHELDIDRTSVLGAHGVEASACAGNVIVFAGKLTRFKGVDVLLEAAALYEQRIAATTGHIPLTVLAGDGEERASLKAQAERLGLKAVRFLGNVSQQELCRLYNSADTSIVPSRREPFGLVAIEAMACGIPVIASNEGGLPDFVNNEVGALVEPENPEALAEAVIQTLERVADDRSGTWRHAIAAYVRNRYAQDRIIEELADLYERIAGA